MSKLAITGAAAAVLLLMAAAPPARAKDAGGPPSPVAPAARPQPPAGTGAAPGELQFQSRDWRGRPIQYSCSAKPGDAEGLKQALIRHELFRIGADSKAQTGWYYGNRLRDARLKMREAAAGQIVDRIKRRLAADAQSLRTAALVYDVGVAGGEAMLCVWLLTPAGIAAAETVPIPRTATLRLGTFSDEARRALNVTTAALSRAPRQKGTTRALPPVTAETAAAAPRGELLDRIGALLLPRSVRRAVLESRSERVLVLPAADFSTIPFAALPIGDGRVLVDVASLVLLTGVDELTQPLSRDIWSSRFTNGGLTKLVIADPDASEDALEWDRLPGAREEAEQISRLTRAMNGPTLAGKDASLERVRAELKAPGLGLVYFATHGIADPADPVRGSFLLLTGGRMRVSEIVLQTHKAAPLVVLSACQSGLGKTFEGGTFGIARGWLTAGAPQIVTSLWDIGDKTTKDLMADFMSAAVAGDRPEVALRKAMLAARDTRRQPASVWAGFAMLGFASE